MQISRRDALMGATAAAVVTGAITVPLAIKSAGVQAALTVQTDPVAVLVAKSEAYDEWLNTIGGTVSDDEFDVLCALGNEMQYEIRDTPSASIEGIRGKVRIAWQNTAIGIKMERNGPPEDFDEIYPLDPMRFIWSALKDLERLAKTA